jgi:hypothetical protein
VQKTRHQRIRLLTDWAIALLTRGQRGEGGAHMTASIAIKTALTAKALPLPEEGPGYSRTPAESRLQSRMGLGRQGGLAHIIHHDVQSSQESVHIDHRAAPSLGEDRAILQVDGTFRSTVNCPLTPSVKDFEALPETTEAWVRIAMIQLMVRRLAARA